MGLGLELLQSLAGSQVSWFQLDGPGEGGASGLAIAGCEFSLSEQIRQRSRVGVELRVEPQADQRARAVTALEQGLAEPVEGSLRDVEAAAAVVGSGASCIG